MDGQEKRAGIKEIEMFFTYFSNVREVYNLP